MQEMSSLTKATLKFDQGNRQTMFIPFVFVYIFSLLLLIIPICMKNERADSLFALFDKSARQNHSKKTVKDGKFGRFFHVFLSECV